MGNSLAIKSQRSQPKSKYLITESRIPMFLVNYNIYNYKCKLDKERKYIEYCCLYCANNTELFSHVKLAI